MAPNDDPLDRLLGLPDESSLVIDDAFRERLRSRTSQLVARRGWRRRLTRSAGFGACYAAGMLTMWLLTPAGKSFETAEVLRPRLEVVDRSSPRGIPEKAMPEVASPPSAADVLKRKADETIRDTSDIAAALRLYSQALRVERRGQKASDDSNDHWIYLALKNAREEEAEHGPSKQE